MFSARLFIFLVSLIHLGYDTLLSKLSDKQRKKPLPEEVADIYDEERYQTYLNYTADYKRIGNIKKAINLVIDMFFIFSPIYAFIEEKCNYNPYAIVIVTFLCIWIVGLGPNIYFSHYQTFVIEEKYGKNKKDMKEFVKDKLLGIIPSLIITPSLLCILVFLGEHLPKWTNYGNTDLKTVVIVVLVLLAGGFVLSAILKVISYVILKKKYVFTELEDGELKTKINELQASSKKKVKKIYVYNESKKSTSKNAFLLKLYWHREFGIADNFLDENSLDELLGVLSHEIGHLKHKKDIFEYLGYIFDALIVIFLGYILYNPAPAYALNAWVRDSFGLHVNSYYVLFIVYSDIVEFFMWIFGLYDTYCSKRDEYEADREAVKNGYGEPLITMFKRLSTDELVNVNPHPFVEAVEYSHPGMYKRIKAIRAADEKRKQDIGEQ